jgi:hypothetical protein
MTLCTSHNSWRTNFAARIRDTYEKSRAEDFERFPQFRDLPVPKAPGGNAPAAGTGGFKYLGKEGG